MDIKKEKAVINDKNLESVTGGTTAPDLPAAELENSSYKDMFSGAVITETTQDEKSTAHKVGIFPGLSGFP